MRLRDTDICLKIQGTQAGDRKSSFCHVRDAPANSIKISLAHKIVAHALGTPRLWDGMWSACACELNQDQPRAQSRRARPRDSKVMGWDVSICEHFIANLAIPHFCKICISPILHFPISPIWTLLQIFAVLATQFSAAANRPTTDIYA